MPDFCYRCGSRGHNRDQCTSGEELCFKCKKPGHWMKDCPSRQNFGLRGCSLCGRTGHGPPSCPQRKCFRCEKRGHWARECDLPFRTDINFRCWKCASPDHDASSCDSPKPEFDPNADEDVISPPRSPSPVSSEEGGSALQWKIRGNEAYSRKDFDFAVYCYSKAILYGSTDPLVWSNRAAAHVSMKHFRLGLADCQHAITMQGSQASVKLLNRFGHCHYATGSVLCALSVFRQVLAKDPDDVKAKEYRDKTLALRTHISDFERARSAGDWSWAQNALTQCTRALDEEGGEIPHEWRCWEVHVQIALRNWDAARTAVDLAIQDHNQSSELARLRGLLLFLTGKPTLAVQQLDAALKLDSDNLEARELRKRVKKVETLMEQGRSHFRDSEWSKAFAIYDQILDLIERKDEEACGGYIRAIILSNKATVCLKLDWYGIAETLVQAALILHPRYSKLLRTQAKIHRRNENYEAAVDSLRQAFREATTPEEKRAIQPELEHAELLLKRKKNGYKDYYHILGVARGCTDTDIKKAYRRESLKHHPDRGGDEEQFKLVLEAYEVLIDSVKRRLYDLR